MYAARGPCCIPWLQSVSFYDQAIQGYVVVERCRTISSAVYVSMPPSAVFEFKHPIPGTADVNPFSKGPSMLTVCV